MFKRVFFSLIIVVVQQNTSMKHSLPFFEVQGKVIDAECEHWSVETQRNKRIQILRFLIT